MTDTKGKPQKVLAEDLESLRDQIARLQRLVLEYATAQIPPTVAYGPIEWGAATWSNLIDNGLLGMALVDAGFRFLKANKALCNMLGYSEQELTSLHLQDIAWDQNTCVRLIAKVFEEDLPHSKTDTRLLTKRGEAIWVQITVFAISGHDTGKPDLCLLFLEDIGDRKQSEAVLKADKQLLERLINSSVDGIFAFDRELVITVWNPGMERVFGIGAKAALGKPAFQACPFLKELGEDLNISAALRGKKTISRDKRYSIPSTAKQGYFEGYYSPMYDMDSGDVIGGLAIIRDVTDRKAAEENKRVIEDRYRELFENAYDMIYTCDLSGKITSLNKAAERILGYTRSEAPQMRFSQLVAPEFQQIARRMIDRQIADEAPVTQELEILAKDGRRVALEVSNRLIYREGKPLGIQGIARDITQRKKTEEDLQQANQKLEAWVQELEQRTHEMTLLSDMDDILRACMAIEEAYEVIVRVAQELFPAQGGALYVIGPLRNIVEAVAEWGNPPPTASSFSSDDCWALRRGRVHWVEDTHIGLLCKHLQSPAPKGYLCVPMTAQSEALGVLHLTQLEDVRMPEAKQRLAVAMAEHVAMALANLKLHETLRNQYIRDPLTGLFNRSFMEEALELELRRAARTQHPLSIIMLALDNMEALIDKYGPETSDSALREIGLLLQANVRRGDIACRFGDQIFVLILPQGNLEVGRQRVESLRDLVRMLEISSGSTPIGPITLSIGLAVFPAHGRTVEALLRSAEGALSRARTSGGDCIVISD